MTAGASETSIGTAEGDVLKALSQIIDPDFGTDIVSCGFVKDMLIDEASGEVTWKILFEGFLKYTKRSGGKCTC